MNTSVRLSAEIFGGALGLLLAVIAVSVAFKAIDNPVIRLGFLLFVVFIGWQLQDYH